MAAASCTSSSPRSTIRFRVAPAAESIVVHLVPSEANALADLFGGETGDEIDKFERCDWRPGPDGTPVLEQCGNWFAGRILERITMGDHDGFLLEPFQAHSEEGERPFTFHRARRIEPGHPA